MNTHIGMLFYVANVIYVSALACSLSSDTNKNQDDNEFRNPGGFIKAKANATASYGQGAAFI